MTHASERTLTTIGQRGSSRRRRIVIVLLCDRRFWWRLRIHLVQGLPRRAATGLGDGDPDMRFKYGSIGAERDAGIPYWIFYVLPRIFPDKLPGPGGLRRARRAVGAGAGAAGRLHQEGHRLSARREQLRRLSHRELSHDTLDENPTFVAAGPGHTQPRRLLPLPRRLRQGSALQRRHDDARDQSRSTDLSFVDRLIYRFLLIPITKKRLLEREQQFAWIYRTARFSGLGPRPRRRDESDQVLHDQRADGRHASARPTCRRSGISRSISRTKGHTLNLAGDSHDADSVIMDSALGLLGAPPKHKDDFLGQVKWLHEYLSALPGAEVSVPDRRREGRARARAVFDHEVRGVPLRANAPAHGIPLAEVGTDREPSRAWNKDAAIAANKVVTRMGIERKGLVEATLDGYIVRSSTASGCARRICTTARCRRCATCSSRPRQRPKMFYRGYDVYDSVESRLRRAGPGRAAYRHTITTSVARAAAMRATSSAQHCLQTRRMRWLNI